MVSSRRDRGRGFLLPSLVWFAALLTGCAVGDGEGRVAGLVTALDCDLEGDRYDLRPTFFGASAFEDFLDVRIQRGSDFEDRSDGLLLSIARASELKDLLGTPVPLRDEPGALVRMGLYLNATCPWDFTGLDRPMVMSADEGVIVFDAVYAPEVDDGAPRTAARFQDVRLRDPSDPDGRHAVLSGSFRFIFNRGRPAQRFP